MKSHKIYCNGSHAAFYSTVRRAVRAVLLSEGIETACEVSFLFTDDEDMRNINLEQRGIDSVTDVLSFPLNEFLAGTFDEGIAERNLHTQRVMLGDVVISVSRCREQAREYGHSVEREMSYLTVHSVLHLLGYDHPDDSMQKKVMRGRENAAMEKLGFKND